MLTVEQQEQRRVGIGSSEIAAVCGISSWGTPISIWLQKTGKTQPVSNDNDDDATIRLEKGDVLEPLIAARYTRRTGEDLLEPKRVFSSPTRSWQLATPDRLRVSDGRIVECKNASYGGGEWGESGTDEVPQQYICQIQWQMDVLEQDFAHLAAFVGDKLRIYTIHYDAELCGFMREVAERFWTDYVLTNTQPPVSGSDVDSDYLRDKFRLYKTGAILQSSDELDTVAACLAEASARHKQVEDEVNLYKNQLREAIGEAEGIKGAAWKATWKSTKAASVVDWEAVAKELGASPDVIAKHTGQKKNSRRFLFSWKGGE